MKKSGIVITILLVILVIHGVVLWLFLHGGKKEAAAPEARIPAGPPQPQKLFEGDAGMEVTPEQYRMLKAKASLGKPFNYTYAVNGNIPQLAASANGSAGILVDLETRNVLWNKNAERAVPIASMTKIMTVLLAYETVLDKSSGITLDTPVKVSVAAYKIGGSQVYLDPKETFTVRDLMMAASIKSANDAAYLLAEFFGKGDVQSFVDRMNRRAAELGMKHTRFHNPHGLPGATSAEDNVSSPEDMVRLAEASLLHPQLVEWASTWTAPFRTPGTKGFIQMQNHNHLIPGADTVSPGVNGLKTGFIVRSGYCLTVTCTRGGRRVVGVVMGYPTWKERDRFVSSLLNWGYARAANPANALLSDAERSGKRTGGNR